MTDRDHDHILISDWNQLSPGLPVRVWCDWCNKKHHVIVGNYLGTKSVADIAGFKYKSKVYDILPNCSYADNRLSITEASIARMQVEECLDEIMEAERRDLLKPLLSNLNDNIKVLERIAA